MLRRYTFKIYPNATQEAALREQARLCAVLWNALLEMREEFYRRAKQRGDKKTSLTAFDQGKDLTAMNADPDCAEFKALGRGTQERVAEALDLAMKAFFKRAKAGAGASSGYPRYKSTRHADSIMMREPKKSGWKFEPKGSNGGCPSADFSARGKREHSTNDGACNQSGADAPRLRGGDRSTVSPPPIAGGADAPRLGGDDSYRDRPAGGVQWRLTLRGVPGAIKARGKFPADPESFKTADVKFYDGAWWLSICVDVPARMTAGKQKLTVELDLIERFATVKSANGQCVPGLSDPFSDGRKGEFPHNSRAVGESPCGDPANAGGAQVVDKREARHSTCGDPADAGGARGVRRIVRERSACGDPANAGGAQEGPQFISGKTQADAIQSERDRRYKRGSIRWRREKQRIARIKAQQARRTKEALHKWTTDIVRQAAELAIIAPPVKKLTRTGKGDEKHHGAEVKTVAALNRHVLSMAPASAVQMLEYKAAEAGVACMVERREDHQISAGADLRAAAVAVKRAKRTVKRKQKLLEAAE